MEKDWVIVFTASNLPEAEMVKALLSENGINAVTLDKQGGPYVIGDIELYVNEADLDAAKEVLSKQAEN